MTATTETVRRTGTPHGDVTVRRVEHAADLRDLLADAAGPGRHLVLDLAGLHMLDPDGLALLVRVRQLVRQEHDGWLCLAAPSRLVLTVLHTMRLERAFPTFADSAAALAWLTGGASTEAPAPLWAGLITESVTEPS
ncbi:MAG: STAS domain-containing protein [Actinoplanes sp.]